jgi:hypothetical protein
MRVVSALATFVAGCALALVVAHWGWQIFGPAPVQIAAAAPGDPAAAIIAANLFSHSDASAAGDAPADAMLSGDAQLLGIVAGPQQQGYALFRLRNGPRLVAQGQEIVAGVTLLSVEPDAITIREGAHERRLVLRASAGATATPASPARATLPPAASVAGSRNVVTSSCAPPAGFGGNVVRLNAELLGGLSTDAGPWRTLLTPANGGLVVRESGGFGAMLGLESGDHIAQANGIALRVPDDVASAVIRPLLANQGVRVVGSRAGAKHELWLANIACASAGR